MVVPDLNSVPLGVKEAGPSQPTNGDSSKMVGTRVTQPDSIQLKPILTNAHIRTSRVQLVLRGLNLIRADFPLLCGPRQVFERKHASQIASSRECVPAGIVLGLHKRK